MMLMMTIPVNTSIIVKAEMRYFLSAFLFGVHAQVDDSERERTRARELARDSRRVPIFKAERRYVLLPLLIIAH